MTFRLTMVLLAVCGFWTSFAAAKPNDNAPFPDTQFRVPSAQAQDFYEEIPALNQIAFTPITEVPSMPPIFGAVGGAGLDAALLLISRQWITVLPSDASPYRNVAGGFHKYGSESATWLTIDFQKWRMAREAFAMAETFRHEGNFAEAERWSASASSGRPVPLWRLPCSAKNSWRWSALSVKRLKRTAGNRRWRDPNVSP